MTPPWALTCHLTCPDLPPDLPFVPSDLPLGLPFDLNGPFWSQFWDVPGWPASHLEWKNQWFFNIFTFCILTMARLILDEFWHHLGGLDGLCWPLLAYLWPVLVLLWRPLAPLWHPLATGRASLGSPGAQIVPRGSTWTT